MTEPAGSVAKTLSFGPFTVTPHERLMTRDGIPLPLGAKAFDLLIALMSRPNEVVSKWDLMALVWPGLTVEEASLRFHIAALRKALGDGSDGARYITTLSGRGYCFVAPISRAAIPAERCAAPRGGLSPVKLPNRLQRMVGRDDAIAAVSDKLIASRFVTIAGPGGVGKTAVAVAIAHDLLETFADAAHFVDLAALSDPDLVITSILLMLGLPAQTDDPLPALLAHLRDKRMLLILDNCEHVIAAVAPLAAEIFHAAPHVHIMATSREALRVEGEQVYRLAPLAVPPDRSRLTVAAARTYPALQLFLERATASGAQIALDDANAAIIARICRKLDGMALAIELAAGRVEAYGLEQTATLLDERLNLLWQGQRTAPPRQKTLQATLDWSYGLLTHTERLVLRRLAVFAGHFTIDAALEVVPDKRVDRSHLFDAIDSLVAKSMVAPRPIGAMMRYRLLDTTRAYLLEIEPNDAGLAGRHATYYRQWLEQAGSTWATVPSADERAIHFSALHNVRAALDWCFGTDGNVGIGMALAAAAAPIFLAMSLLIECRRWSERALLAIDPSSRGSAEEMHIQAALGLTLMFTRGGSEAARAALSRSLAIAQGRCDEINQLQLLGRMHIFHERMGEFDAALRYAQQSLTVAEALGDAASTALAHSLLGVSLHLAGEHHDALTMLEAAWLGPGTERISTVYGFDHRNRAGISLARELWLQGRPAQAQQLARQTVTEAAQMDHPITLCIALIWAVSIDLWNGDLNDAEANIDRFIAHAESRSMSPYLAVGRGVKGELAIRRGNAADGLETIRACLHELHDAGYELLTTTFNIAMVQGFLAIGQIEQSARLVDEAIRLVEQGGDHLYMPELLRMKGRILLSLPEPNAEQAEAHFMQSLDLSRHRGAKAWELRAAIDLAELLAERGRREHAKRLLQSALDGFATGSETTDITAANRLLAMI
ncbi:winged helix-turn-helix domain-containing protein [Bradyrhizobium sp. 180]|uniref:ATP-binding protein n=1 Tax=unclassified Bradyrhizobium TaxID=2631580 RepID=UPI001FF7AB7F|nr:MULTISPECIES: winged helix-turn-helix domain-containing protein [unclassified Bradyrhizobium]MCK1425413.1 winged helix-turn-helix domain-containing protein [Bradyrhizobium sp. CW12]MCK1493863.1 winged helix-turn-helix domain-containing protein [Bradyrhizobium sp. 180]MCK1531970.1 winged helix-turn-helix domain-containing protein [Bradyrhizobium sp. 182]MCK1595195.1 winged helix-turn-helix domain-containing protein [Bradyrhizobium sp. 164]MCK1621154.1 winged helix-turn-helix domain-containin